jgi:chromosome segregation ATPase
MKGKTGIVVLIVVCVGLLIGLLVRHYRASEDQKAARANIMQLSNQLVRVQADLNEQKTVNMALETNLAVRTGEVEGYSNKFVATTVTLAKTEADAKTAAEAAREEISKLNSRIGELEGQNDDLTKKMGDLNTEISKLEVSIADTEKKLSASEGDREILLKELKRLQSEKAELERKFNDLAVLRDQVRKLKDDLSIARRLEWIRRGLYGSEKGAEKLVKGFAAAPGQTNYDLNVEIRQDGGARVVAPSTNSAPANPPPPKPQ